MRYLFAGGGTGGHIYPAISMAQALQELDQSAVFLFVGSQRGLEGKIVPKYGFPLEYLDIQAFKRRLSWETLVTAYKAARSMPISLGIVKKFRPDVIIGTGGYASGPPVLAGSWLRIPTVLQEQNALPGFTTKLLSRRASKVLVGYSEAKERLMASSKMDPGKILVTGNPIRLGIKDVSREEGCEKLGLNPSKLTIMVIGASQGSRSINNAFLRVWPHLAKRNNVQVIWQTGETQFQTIKDQLPAGYRQDAEGTIYLGNLQLRSYIHEMPYALAASDLVLSRAGAISLAEMTAKGLPSILIPLPTAAENHQEYNARALENAGAAVVILERDLSPETLTRQIESILTDSGLRQKMADASRGLGRPQAAKDAAKVILGLAHEN